MDEIRSRHFEQIEPFVGILQGNRQVLLHDVWLAVHLALGKPYSPAFFETHVHEHKAGLQPRTFSFFFFLGGVPFWDGLKRKTSCNHPFRALPLETNPYVFKLCQSTTGLTHDRKGLAEDTSLYCLERPAVRLSALCASVPLSISSASTARELDGLPVKASWTSRDA